MFNHLRNPEREERGYIYREREYIYIYRERKRAREGKR
jgi:hypothetical protein